MEETQINLQFLNVLFFSSGNSCDVELLQLVDALTERHKEWGLDYLTENVHLITLKTNVKN